jgi:NAD+ diphosphatase
MLQDIEPKVFRNEYYPKSAQDEDLFISFKEEMVLIQEGREKLWYPSFSDFQQDYPDLKEKAQFLFTIDELNYFLLEDVDLDDAAGWSYVHISRFRAEKKYWRSFAGIVAWQLYRWYRDHKFCSRCRKDYQRSSKERLLYCDDCGMLVYPTISPAIIVGVYNGDELLLTKYADREYANYSLVAGFNEVGESLEQTVRREVMEEVGLRVKNIQYYKSQPWPFTDSILVGFFAELDGDDKIILQEDELSLGIWMDRDNVPDLEDNISLTGAMMSAFRSGEYPGE